LNFYYDSSGLIVQENNDGGDTAGREGDYWFYQGLVGSPTPATAAVNKQEFSRVLNLLQQSPGVFVRNPNQPSYNIPSDFSRDQATPLMLAMGIYEIYSPYKLMMLNVLKNWCRFPNGDLVSPEDLSIVIRSFNSWYLYPILLVGDLFTLGESIITCFASKTNTSDDINHTLILLQSQYKFATPISYLARKIYKWFRPGGIQAAWDEYFNPTTSANPFNELYSTLIAKM